MTTNTMNFKESLTTELMNVQAKKCRLRKQRQISEQEYAIEINIELEQLIEYEQALKQVLNMI